MALFRRVRLVGVAVAAVAALLLVLHVSAQSSAPGRYTVWPAAATPTASTQAGPAIAIATAPPATPPPGILSGLSGPVSALFHQLDSNTAQTATGQYSILEELEHAIAQRLDGFLHWIVGRH